jgi:hypothetical protein
MVIGAIEHIRIDEKGLRKDGSLDLNALGTVTVSGLDEYHIGKEIVQIKLSKAGKGFGDFVLTQCYSIVFI